MAAAGSTAWLTSGCDGGGTWLSLGARLACGGGTWMSLGARLASGWEMRLFDFGFVVVGATDA